MLPSCATTSPPKNPSTTWAYGFVSCGTASAPTHLVRMSLSISSERKQTLSPKIPASERSPLNDASSTFNANCTLPRRSKHHKNQIDSSRSHRAVCRDHGRLRRHDRRHDHPWRKSKTSTNEHHLAISCCQSPRKSGLLDFGARTRRSGIAVTR